MMRTARNPLVRRLRRHAEITILFQMASQAPDASSPQRVKAGWSPAVVPQALASTTLTLPQADGTTNPPAGQAFPAEEVLHTTARSGKSFVPPIQRAAATFSSSLSVSNQPSPLPTAESLPDPAPASPQPATSTEPEVWERLKDIYRSHQAKGAGQESNPPSAETPGAGYQQETSSKAPETSPQQKQAGAIPGKTDLSSEQSRADEPARAEITYVTRPPQEDRPTDRTQPASIKTDPDSGKGQPDETRVQRTAAIEGQAAEPEDRQPGELARPDEEPGAQPTEIARQAGEPGLQPGPALAGQVEANPSAPGAPVAVAGDLAGAGTSVQGEAPASQGADRTGTGALRPGSPEQAAPGEPAGWEATVEAEASPGAVIRSLPLQSVWPVQPAKPRDLFQVEPGDAIAGGPSVEPVPQPGVGNIPQPDEGSLGAARETVQSALKNVKSAQPSGSSIELIDPRRPRPKTPVRSGASSSTSSREPIEKPGTSLPEVQLSPDQAHEPAAAEVGDVIPTEIGPLPRDLWSLIGQQPPGQSPGEKETPGAQRDAPAAPPGAPAAAAEALPGPLATHDSLPASSLAPPPGLVQRQETPEATEGSVEAGEAMDRELVAGAQQPSPQEIDELARQVYAEVRRRLALEWERFRGRF